MGARSRVEHSIPEYLGSGADEPVLWMKQTIGHACGLIAEEDEGVYRSWDPGEHFWGSGEDIMECEARGYSEVVINGQKTFIPLGKSIQFCTSTTPSYQCNREQSRGLLHW
jgi:hypothetical protein